MAEIAAIARPYADAVFAVASGDAGRVDAWSVFLARGAAVVSDERVAQLLHNPRADKNRLLELIAEIAVDGDSGISRHPRSPLSGGGDGDAGDGGHGDGAGDVGDGHGDIDGDTVTTQRNLLKLLAANGRLAALPTIHARFEQLRAAAEGEVDAELVTAFAVGSEQQNAIAQALSRKLGRRVRLSAREDSDLIGGAIVRAGDLVIDASVRGQLQQLTGALDA